jgi:hypothetical protein
VQPRGEHFQAKTGRLGHGEILAAFSLPSFHFLAGRTSGLTSADDPY